MLLTELKKVKKKTRKKRQRTKRMSSNQKPLME
jgi:hypothetical protein